MLGEECDEEGGTREDQKPTLDVSRNCCCEDFEAAGSASLRRKTLAAAAMVILASMGPACGGGFRGRRLI